MSNVKRIPLPKPEQPEAEATVSSEKVAQVIMTLLDALPAYEQERVLKNITALMRPIPAPRAGNVLGAVVRLFPTGSVMTVEEIKKRVDENGVRATAKEIYNALGYLRRKGHIQRIGYGQYRLRDTGAGFEHEDWDDGTIRRSENDD